MGSDCHVVVVGGPTGLAARAVALVDGLEARWSRFLSDSEISRLNEAGGRGVAVSLETMLLVERAIEGWQISSRRFDPTVLGDVIRAGYDRTFSELGPHCTTGSMLRPGCDGIVVDRVNGTVRLPIGVGFDPGGIGKGLGADLVVAELRAAGADGVCVNLGGDVRLAGAAPRGDSWRVGIEHDLIPGLAATIPLRDGAVATSTTTRRVWQTAAGPRHHLLDPASGQPSTTGTVAVSVVAAEGWLAEVLTKVVVVDDLPSALRVVTAVGAEAIVLTADGRRHATPALRPFMSEVAA
jgi:thiamine biosynthesis lipoprotein